jgi:hypothetical protein
MAPATSAPTISRAGELNVEHTRMFTAFKKHLKLLLAEEDPLISLAGASAAVLPASALKTNPRLWVEKCGGEDTASNSYEAVRSELRKFIRFGRDYPWGKGPSVLPWLTWRDVLHAASWYHENRIILKEAHEVELAYTFQLTHQADAPFMAAVNLCDFHNRRADREEIQSSLAFMRIFAEEMNEWYDYDAQSKEPMVENVARGCRCLPRHIKNCPCKKK